MFRDTRIFFKSLFQSFMPLKTLSSRLTFNENKVFFGWGNQGGGPTSFDENDAQ
jgi:hypothetical protein